MTWAVNIDGHSSFRPVDFRDFQLLSFITVLHRFLVSVRQLNYGAILIADAATDGSLNFNDDNDHDVISMIIDTLI